MFSGKSNLRVPSGKFSRLGKSVRRHSGGALLELALTLGILFSICYGLIEYGYYFYVKDAMQSAVREGCRQSIEAGATFTTANTAMQNQLLAAGLITSSNTVSGSSGSYTIGNYSITYYDTTAGSTVSSLSGMTVGDTLTVTMTGTWGVVGASFRPEAIIGYGKQLSVSSSMRKEGD